MPRLLHAISSQAASGAERIALDLARVTRDAGEDVGLLLPFGEGWLSDEARRHGLAVERRPMRGIGFLRTAWALKSHHGLIHAHLTRALNLSLPAARAGVPTVATVHIYNAAPVYRRLAQAGAVLAPVSEYVAENLRRQGVPDEAMVVCPNGTDLGFAPPTDVDALRASLGFSPDRFVVGVFGRIHEWKGQDRLVKGLAELPDSVVALVVGRTAQGRETLVAEAAEAAGVTHRVTMIGPQTDIVPYLDAVDAVAMPSERETFGLVALEAASRGKPVIAANVGALPEVVTHERTGLLTSRDPHDLATAIRTLFENREMARTWGAAGRERVMTEFTLAAMTTRYRNIYARLTHYDGVPFSSEQ